MIRLLVILSFCILTTVSLNAQDDARMIRRIFDEVLRNGQAYEQLRSLTQTIGPRLSGSPQAAAAVDWSAQLMRDLEFDRVFLQEVMVPHWVRGEEASIRVINSTKYGPLNLNVTALGNSIGTGPKGLSGQVIEVKEFLELLKLGEEQLTGKIVFFNRRMDPTEINAFSAYGITGDQRRAGPSEAAKFGASAVIVRSLTQLIDEHPHTGATRYGSDSKPIPAVAISTQDAERLSALLKEEPNVQVRLQSNAKIKPDKLSHNVIGEIRGNQYPDQYIVIGGHLDSWDVGEGAHDDGAGCVHAIEVLRALKAIGYKPKRTLRAVMFMNEENGLRGGSKYAELAETRKEKHIAAIESDRGGFTPKGFTLDMNALSLERIQSWKHLFEPYGIYQFLIGGGGADIGPLRSQGVPLIGFMPDDNRYFKYHHTEIDTFDKVDERELHMGAASMAALVYLIDKYGL